jgi:hypothetical protein
MAPTQACGERTAPFRLLIIVAAAVASTIWSVQSRAETLAAWIELRSAGRRERPRDHGPGDLSRGSGRW